MRRFLAAASTAVIIWIGPAAAALADPGTPGQTFPEQPGTHVQPGCAAVMTSGAVDAPMSSRALAITSGLFADACSND